MKTLENKIAAFLLEEDYKEWDLTLEYEAGAEPFMTTIPGTTDEAELEAALTDGEQLTFVAGPVAFRPNEAQVKLLNDYLYGLTGYPIFK